MNDNSIKRFWTKPPMLFPWVALFHIGATIFSIVLNGSEPLSSAAWLQPAWMLAYTLAWIFVCDMKRWAAFSYIGITSASLVARFVLRNDPGSVALYTSVLFPVDIIFSFFILFFFRRFS